MSKPLTVREAAERLGLSTHTIRAWIFKRRLSYVRIGRAIRVPESEINRLLAEGFVSAQENRGGSR